MRVRMSLLVVTATVVAALLASPVLATTTASLRHAPLGQRLSHPAIVTKAKKKPKPKIAKDRPVPITGPGPLGGTVPGWAIAAFATLEQPRAASISSRIVAMFNKPKQFAYLRKHGIDYHEARQIDVASRRLYLVPGRDAICLFFPGFEGPGTICAANDGPFSFHNGISILMVPPPTSKQLDGWVKDRSKPYPTGKPVVAIGVAPRGVTQVMLHGQDGHDRLASQVGEGYVGALDTPIIAKTFSGPEVPAFNDAPYAPGSGPPSS
jgi:hypothetical protein